MEKLIKPSASHASMSPSSNEYQTQTHFSTMGICLSLPSPNLSLARYAECENVECAMDHLINLKSVIVTLYEGEPSLLR